VTGCKKALPATENLFGRRVENGQRMMYIYQICIFYDIQLCKAGREASPLSCEAFVGEADLYPAFGALLNTLATGALSLRIVAPFSFQTLHFYENF